MGSKRESFGAFVKAARLKRGLGLRQVARDLETPAAYLSRVENDIEAPSGELIAQMAKRYQVPIEDLTRLVARTNSTATAYGHILQNTPELRALYRLGTQLDSSIIDELIRRALKKQGTSEAEIEKTLSSLKSELPRVANSTREGLFAADAKPRFLTKQAIAGMAEKILERNNLGENSYAPPTPVELIVEKEPSVLYRIEELKCDKFRNPLVLGLTGWGEGGERQIVVNSVLADSHRESDAHRFNFTLAHELFHAVEHLPRIPKETVPPLARMQLFIDGEQVRQQSRAERAVNSWASGKSGPRGLSTNEDWREWQANTFAAALLMPSWAVVREFKLRTGAEEFGVLRPNNARESALELASQRVFQSTICEQSLAELFEVSRQAMAIRLLQLQLVREVTG
jgi:transcriptional regulator with XRE-family HTH domain